LKQIKLTATPKGVVVKEFFISFESFSNKLGIDRKEELWSFVALREYFCGFNFSLY